MSTNLLQPGTPGLHYKHGKINKPESWRCSDFYTSFCMESRLQLEKNVWGRGPGRIRTCLLCLCFLLQGHFYLLCIVMVIANLVEVLGGGGGGGGNQN